MNSIIVIQCPAWLEGSVFFSTMGGTHTRRDASDWLEIGRPFGSVLLLTSLDNVRHASSFALFHPTNGPSVTPVGQRPTPSDRSTLSRPSDRSHPRTTFLSSLVQFMQGSGNSLANLSGDSPPLPIFPQASPTDKFTSGISGEIGCSPRLAQGVRVEGPGPLCG